MNRHLLPTRVMLLIVVIVMLLSAIFSIVQVKRYVAQVSADTNQLYSLSCDAYVGSVRDKLNSYRMAMELIAVNAEIRQNIFRQDVSRMQMVELSSHLETLMDGMTFFLNQSGGINSHRLYTYLPGDGRYFWDIDSLHAQPWYPQAEASVAASTHAFSYSNTDRVGQLILIGRINSFGTQAAGSKKALACYQTMTLNLDRLFALRAEFFHGLEADVFVYGSDGALLYATDQALNGLAQEVYSRDSGAGIRTADGQLLTPMIRQIDALDMTVLLLFAPTQLVIQGYRSEFVVLLTLGAALLILLSVLLVFYWRYMRRIQALLDKIDSFDEHLPEVSGFTQGNGEIDRIDRHVGRMQNRVVTLIREEYTAKIQKMKAQQEALAAYINPHFLYNTLNAISAMACMEGADRSVEMIAALSGMFRYSSDISEKYVVLMREVQNIRDYLYIQRIRCQDALSCQIDIPEELLMCRVPKLILQPLVENAFKHGFKGKQHKELIICAQRVGEIVVLTVRDNGAGIAPQRLEEITQGLNNPDGPGRGDTGTRIGLYNVHQRVRMQCGPDCGLRISSAVGVYTCVEIRLTGQEEEQLANTSDCG